MWERGGEREMRKEEWREGREGGVSTLGTWDIQLKLCSGLPRCLFLSAVLFLFDKTM